MQSLTCLGIGDGWPCGDRNHSSFLYRLGDTTLLIDCGEPLSRSFKATGFSYNLIDAIFLSHLHFDHVGGFFMFFQGLWLEKRTKDLPIYLPANGIDPIRQLLNAGCVFDELLGFCPLFQPIEAATTYDVNGVRVTAWPTTHLKSLEQSFRNRYSVGFEAFAFVIECDQLRIGHTADIGAIEDLEPLLAKPLDVLVCELAHVTPVDLFRFLQRRKIGRIVFVHVGRSLWEDLATVESLAKEMLAPIPVVFARDGAEFPLR
jgi:ribonuclease BN (tRNA processing enzyme)